MIKSQNLRFPVEEAPQEGRFEHVSAFWPREYSSLFMLFPLGIVLSLGLLFLIVGLRWARHKHLHQFIEPVVPAPRPVFLPSLFDQPTRWLAIKGNNLIQVQ